MTGAQSRRRQRGLGLLTLILFAVVLVFAVLLVMKVFPTATEYWAIKKAASKAAQEGGATVQAVRASFDRAATIDDIRSISGKDLDITKDAQGHVVVAFKYEKKLELFGPASLLLEYEGSSTEGQSR